MKLNELFCLGATLLWVLNVRGSEEHRDEMSEGALLRGELERRRDHLSVRPFLLDLETTAR